MRMAMEVTRQPEPAMVCQVPESGVPPGGISLPPGGIIGAVCFAVVGCRPSRPGQGGGEKAQRQNQGQTPERARFCFTVEYLLCTKSGEGIFPISIT